MKREMLMLILGSLGATAGHAADRAIALAPVMTMTWSTLTPNGATSAARGTDVGFWQRSSGAKPGVGAIFVATMEYQLPETPPARVRAATFEFTGRPWQCAGAEPVVVDVYAYPADGRSEPVDANAGVRVAQLRADCAAKSVFGQRIDVSAMVRQLSVPAGVRHIGFNVRKANNRQGPSHIKLAPGKLTVVLADQDLAQLPAPSSTTTTATTTTAPQAATGPNGLIKAFGTLVRGAGSKAAREQAKGEALDGLANLPTSPPAQAGQATQ